MTSNKAIFAIRTKIQPLYREIQALKFGRKGYMKYQGEMGSILVATSTICLVIRVVVNNFGVSPISFHCIWMKFGGKMHHEMKSRKYQGLRHVT